MFVRRGGGRGSVYFPSPEGAVYPDNQSVHFTLHASVGSGAGHRWSTLRDSLKRSLGYTEFKFSGGKPER